jgi:hypothetical protein
VILSFLVISHFFNNFFVIFVSILLEAINEIEKNLCSFLRQSHSQWVRSSPRVSLVLVLVSNLRRVLVGRGF